MALRYAILGYLSSAPGSGYDLGSQLDQGLGWFWSASNSQIYPAVKALEEEGLVSGRSTTTSGRSEKTVYTITDKGLDELREWADAPPSYRPNRDPERLQLIFADLCDVESVRRHLEAHRDRYRERAQKLRFKRDQITERRHERIERRVAGHPDEQQIFTIMLRDFAYSGDIARAEQEIEWAEEALETLAQYENDPAAVADRYLQAGSPRAA